MTAGIRSSRPSGRHLAYQHESATIDVCIEASEAPDRIWLAGQVLDANRNNNIDGLSVVLITGKGTLAQTATNRSGEFYLESDSAEDAGLEIRFSERSWVLVPLGKMDWLKKPMPNLQTEKEPTLPPASALHKANGSK